MSAVTQVGRMQALQFTPDPAMPVEPPRADPLRNEIPWELRDE